MTKATPENFTALLELQRRDTRMAHLAESLKSLQSEPALVNALKRRQAAVAKADAQIEAATLLGRRLADSLKDRGIPPAYTRQWTNEMCRVLESGATPHQVEYIIDYLPSDTFWSGLVVDAKYFADKYPKLVAAARSHVHKQVNAERPAWMQERERRRAAAQHEPS